MLIFISSIFLLLLTSSCMSSTPITLTAILNSKPTDVSSKNIVHEHHHEHPWHQFKNLKNARRGSHDIPGIIDLKNYFHRFGYLPKHCLNATKTNNFDSHLEHALALYQTHHGLPVTKVLDSNTLAMILTPRCGFPDHFNIDQTTTTTTTSFLHASKHYVYFQGQPRWTRQIPITLTYSISNHNLITYLTSHDINSAFRHAFTQWESVIPVTFTQTTNYASADIKIGFHDGDHGDGEPFDGPLGVLAHAFSPESGRLHLDKAERWAVDFTIEKSKSAVDLESVALHEIGHVLGLAHSMEKSAVMYPSLKPRDQKLELSLDDVKGVQALYGSNPNFSIQSLLASETSASVCSSCFSPGKIRILGLVDPRVIFSFFLLLLFISGQISLS